MNLTLEEVINTNITDEELEITLSQMSKAEVECLLSAVTNNTMRDPNVLYCNTTWDKASCWHSTAAGQLLIIPCFDEFNSVPYDTTQNATRLCQWNGTWADRADYDRCKPLIPDYEILKSLWNAKEAATIYYIGYGGSLIALTIALGIFFYFKDLRCVRNTIHTNLMITYMLIAICWIITDRLHANPSSASNKASCTLVILLTYLMGTNFFWMFVEGLYLYILVVKTFSIELVKVQIYAFIGWGLPAIVVTIWASVKMYFTKTDHYVPTGCPWQFKDVYDNIFVGPVIIVLVINIFFLAKIMWVLITKLRAATTAESKQYRKAAKALLVLIPLLGVAYMLVLVTPNHKTAKVIFQYLQAILVSTQGFTVAVLYCFCNGEVRNSLRHHFERFKLRRNLRCGQYPVVNRNTYAFRSLRYGENVRLYRTRRERDRGSSISCTTSTTYVTNNSLSGKLKRQSINGLTNNSGPVVRCVEDVI